MNPVVKFPPMRASCEGITPESKLPFTRKFFDKPVRYPTCDGSDPTKLFPLRSKSRIHSPAFDRSISFPRWNISDGIKLDNAFVDKRNDPLNLAQYPNSLGTAPVSRFECAQKCELNLRNRPNSVGIWPVRLFAFNCSAPVTFK